MSRIVWSTLDRASAGSFHDQGCRLESLTALSCDDWHCCRKFAVNPDLSLRGSVLLPVDIGLCHLLISTTVLCSTSITLSDYWLKVSMAGTSWLSESTIEVPPHTRDSCAF